MKREDLEALLEACFSDDEYRQNKTFNEFLDTSEPENRLTICLRDEDGTECPISSISKALFYSDKQRYKQLLTKFKRDQKHIILEPDKYQRNIQRFDALQLLVSNKKVLPFIGAGMSVAAGFKTWSHYLLDLATEARMNVDEVKTRLIQGEHEFVVEDIVKKLSRRFERDFPVDFNQLFEELDGPIKLVPNLSSGCIITTNFDKVIEQSYEKAGTPISNIVTGLESNGRFARAMAASDSFLLKLHGHFDILSSRILRKTEYDSAYGANGIDFDLPLPRLLCHIYTSSTLLFLGCSLTNDRTMQVFKAVCDEMGHDSIPKHYAILSEPEDSDLYDIKEQFLADRNIYPIWYSTGEHEKLNDILFALVNQ